MYENQLQTQKQKNLKATQELTEYLTKIGALNNPTKIETLDRFDRDD